MNDRTRRELVEFINSVETLTHGVHVYIGTQTASEVIQACENAKQALNSDETIVEVS